MPLSNGLDKPEKHSGCAAVPRRSAGSECAPAGRGPARHRAEPDCGGVPSGLGAAPVMTAETNLLRALDSLGISWTIHEHEAVFTVEASAQLHQEIAGAHTKNLFLKDAGGQFWVISAPHDASVDLKALPDAIGCKKVSFGKAEAMEELLGILPGSVTPLAAFNDTAGLVKIVIDRRLAEAEVVNVHPLRNTATLGLAGSDLIRFLAEHGHEPQVVLLPARA